MDIKTWNPDFSDDNKHFTMAIIGSRRQGKSYYLRWLYNTYLSDRFHIICVMTTEQNLDFYSEYIPSDLIMSGFRDDVLIGLKDKQDAFLESHNSMPHILLILDDVVTNDMKRSEEIKKIYATGRHLNISCVTLIQDAMFLSVACRENLDFLICTRQKTARSKEYLCMNFLGDLVEEEELNGLSEKKFLKELITKKCIDYNMLVVDFNCNSDKFEDLVFMTKAI